MPGGYVPWERRRREVGALPHGLVGLAQPTAHTRLRSGGAAHRREQGLTAWDGPSGTRIRS